MGASARWVLLTVAAAFASAATAACGGADFTYGLAVRNEIEAGAGDGAPADDGPAGGGEAGVADAGGGDSQPDAVGGDAQDALSDASDAGRDAATVACAGATPPAQFYARTIASGALVACRVEPTPAGASYSCGPILSAWACPHGVALACHDATSTPPSAVVEVDCAP